MEKYLCKCLDSIVNQTLKEIEIILVNDGSTDNSGKIADEYAERDGRMRVIHKKNEGQGSARNIGLKLGYVYYIQNKKKENIISCMAGDLLHPYTVSCCNKIK